MSHHEACQYDDCDLTEQGLAMIPNKTRVAILCQVALTLASPVMAQPAPQTDENVAVCLKQARAAMRGLPSDADRIDAYAANGQIYFYNPFVSQNPTVAFWKCLRLKEVVQQIQPERTIR
jgi:hypothetical protein